MSPDGNILRGNSEDDPIRVVYVCCHGRSGSTLLGAIAGLLPQHSFVGEVRTIWEDGVDKNRNCGCGEPFRSCRFWNEVFNRAYGGFDTPAAMAARDLLTRHTNVSSRPALWWALLRDNPRHETTRALADALAPLYRAIHDVSGGQIIVDTSKHARFGFVVANIPGVEIRIVNLIRDVRGVIFSRARPALMRDGSTRHAQRSKRPHYRTGIILGRWLFRNALAMRLVRRYGGVRVLYEDFVHDQKPALVALSDNDRARIALDRLAHPDPAEIVQHQLAGNWIRNLRIDTSERWPDELPSSVQRIATFFSWPLRRRYRYEVQKPSGFAERPDTRQNASAAR
ncbi:MAG: hypothetical protein SGJ07_01730 [Rhodospirillaceae bacterium]|nr:hypothetical protein [Rhodospirillaceae bacterium]